MSIRACLAAAPGLGAAADSGFAGAALVAAVVGFHFDAFAGFDEEGNLDDETGFHGGGFLDVVGAVTFDALGGFGDGHDHRSGDIDAGDRAVGKEQLVALVFDKVVFNGFDEFRFDADVLIGIRMDEVVAAGILVAEFVADAFDVDGFDAVIGGHAQLGDFAGAQALGGDLDEGPQVGWGFVVQFDDEVGVAAHPDCLSSAHLGDVCHIG